METTLPTMVSYKQDSCRFEQYRKISINIFRPSCSTWPILKRKWHLTSWWLQQTLIVLIHICTYMYICTVPTCIRKGYAGLMLLYLKISVGSHIGASVFTMLTIELRFERHLVHIIPSFSLSPHFLSLQASTVL